MPTDLRFAVLQECEVSVGEIGYGRVQLVIAQIVSRLPVGRDHAGPKPDDADPECATRSVPAFPVIRESATEAAQFIVRAGQDVPPFGHKKLRALFDTGLLHGQIDLCRIVVFGFHDLHDAVKIPDSLDDVARLFDLAVECEDEPDRKEARSGMDRRPCPGSVFCPGPEIEFVRDRPDRDNDDEMLPIIRENEWGDQGHDYAADCTADRDSQIEARKPARLGLPSYGLGMANHAACEQGSALNADLQDEIAKCVRLSETEGQSRESQEGNGIEEGFRLA